MNGRFVLESWPNSNSNSSTNTECNGDIDAYLSNVSSIWHMFVPKQITSHSILPPDEISKSVKQKIDFIVHDDGNNVIKDLKINNLYELKKLGRIESHQAWNVSDRNILLPLKSHQTFQPSTTNSLDHFDSTLSNKKFMIFSF